MPNKLHIEYFGAVHQPTIVMLHGWAMHTGVWRPFAQALATNYRVLCVDLPGHGRSAEVDFLPLEALVHELVAQVDVPQAYWLGWSLGGMLATAVAHHYPERVQALLLIASNPCFVQRESWPGMRAPVLQSFMQNLSLDAQATLFRFLGLQVHGSAGAGQLLAALRGRVEECPAPAATVLAGGLALLQDVDLREVLAALHIPKLAILGGKDALVPVALAEPLAALGVNCQVLPKAGHAPFLSHATDCQQLIQQFLAPL